ncbi:MAG: TIGR02444 family protein [Rhodobacter sp.]|nr:TIGR02444 family protein [Rhodobacter sp.]
MSDEDTLWAAITAAYARPGIAPLCLRLQDQGGIDVMLLLGLCYAARALGAPLSPAEVQALRAASEPWRAAAVRPARALRIALRGTVAGVADETREGVRDRLKAVELAAERVQAGIIAAHLASRVAQDAAPLAGLRYFLGGAPVTEGEIAQLLDAFGPGQGDCGGSG